MGARDHRIERLAALELKDDRWGQDPDRHRDRRVAFVNFFLRRPKRAARSRPAARLQLAHGRERARSRARIEAEATQRPRVWIEVIVEIG